MKPFRFWVQTALPLVYDDSLSYYELLCKVVSYVNNMLKAIDEFNETIDEYTQKMDELVQYVHDYFESEEFHDIVIAALDDMAEQGQFDDIIEPIVQRYVGPIQTEVGQLVLDVREVQGGLLSTEAAIVGVKSRIQAVENTVSQLDSRVDTVEAAVSDVEGDITTMQGSINTMQGSISSLRTDVTTLQGNVQTLNTGLAAANNDIDDLQSDVSSLGNDLQDLDETVQEIIDGGLISSDVWKLVAVSGNKIGNCMYIYHGDTAIVFDCGQDTAAVNLVTSLANNGVTKIAAIVISHWHSDHYNGLAALLLDNRFSFDGCVLYKPHGNINYANCSGTWPSYIPGRDTQATADIIAAGGSAVYPTEGQSVEIDGVDGITIVFNNLSAAKFNDYYSVTTDEDLVDTGETTYNNFSMISSVYVGNHKIVFPGDIQPEAQANNRFVPSGASVYVVEHHGLNISSDYQYMNAISAPISVLGAYGSMHEVAIKNGYPTINRVSCVGSLYTTNANDIVIDISNFGVCSSANTTLAENKPTYDGVLACNIQINSGDFNDLVNPGVYTIQNASMLAQFTHAPAKAASGGKLLVMACSSSGAINQVYMCANKYNPVICIRCYAVGSGGGWRPWRYIYPSSYYWKSLPATADSSVTYASGLTLNDETNSCRLWIQNGVLSFSFRFNNDSTLAYNTTFLTVKNVHFATGYYTYFHVFDTAGHGYPCCCGIMSDGSFQVWPLMAIPASDQWGYMGSVSYVIDPDYPTTD